MVNFLNLSYFVKIAEQKNITKVAEQEHISQQSLSNHIKKIELEYGIVLFDRTGPLSLTYAGERLYEYAVKMLSLKHDIENELLDMQEKLQGEIRIGISYTQGSSFLPRILPAFKKQYPYINISVMENNEQVLESYLKNGHIDLYIGSNITDSYDILTKKIADEKLYLIIQKTDAIKIYNTDTTFINRPISHKIFSQCKFILLSRGNEIRKLFDLYLAEKNEKASVIMEAENIETLFALAKKGMGATVYPQIFMKNHSFLINSPDCPISFIPLEGKHSKRTLTIAYKRDIYLSHTIKEFIRIAKENYTFKNDDNFNEW